MIEITVAGPRANSGDVPTIKRLVPAVPRVGEYVGIDDSPGCSGYVHNVQWWWPEGEDTVHVEVQVK